MSTTTSATATFKDLNISPGTLDAVAAMGYESPSPIQGQAIPHLLKGSDLIGQARTGTGKTTAFGIPLVEALRSQRNGGVRALVLVPTRELAIQVAEEVGDLAKASPVRVVSVYGGVGYGRQDAELRRPDTTVLVATPGRLLDHLQRGTVRLGGIHLLVLDEADRMLDMGFLPDVERILRTVPKERQTALFSATMPEPIRRLAERFLRNPVTIRVEAGPEATPNAEQFQVRVEKSQKTRALLALLAKERPERTIVFTRTKHLAKRLARTLAATGHAAVALQGNMSQPQREKAMADFRSGDATLLIATDIVSRGIDVPEVTHVVNLDLPDEPEAYVHRIGRTGRMGRTGRAFTFVQSDQVNDMRSIERRSPVPVRPYDLGELPAEPAPAQPTHPHPPRPPHHGGRSHGGGRREGAQAPHPRTGGGRHGGARHGGRQGGGRRWN